MKYGFIGLGHLGRYLAQSLLRAGFEKSELKELKIFKPNGCPDCNEGYRGRTGIFEVMPISDSIA